MVAGTHRACLPAETVRRIRPSLAKWASPGWRTCTGMDHLGIPTVMVVRPNARSLSVSQGKGDRPRRRPRLRGHGGGGAVARRTDREPADPGVARRSAAGRENVISVARLPRSVRRWDPHLRLLWTEGEDLDLGKSAASSPSRWCTSTCACRCPRRAAAFRSARTGWPPATPGWRPRCTGCGSWSSGTPPACSSGGARPAQWARRVDLDTVADETCRDAAGPLPAAPPSTWPSGTPPPTMGIPSFLCAALDRSFDPFRPVGLARGAAATTTPPWRSAAP